MGGKKCCFMWENKIESCKFCFVPSWQRNHDYFVNAGPSSLNLPVQKKPFRATGPTFKLVRGKRDSAEMSTFLQQPTNIGFQKLPFVQLTLVENLHRTEQRLASLPDLTVKQYLNKIKLLSYNYSRENLTGILLNCWAVVWINLWTWLFIYWQSFS